MKAKPIKAPTIVVKKIPLDNGRKVWGYCYQSEGFIELERDQPDKEFLDTLIHECLHHFFHSLGEQRVSKTATIMANEIWRKGYRSKRRKR